MARPRTRPAKRRGGGEAGEREGREGENRKAVGRAEEPTLRHTGMER